MDDLIRTNWILNVCIRVESTAKPFSNIVGCNKRSAFICKPPSITSTCASFQLLIGVDMTPSDGALSVWIPSPNTRSYQNDIQTSKMLLLSLFFQSPGRMLGSFTGHAVNMNPVRRCFSCEKTIRGPFARRALAHGRADTLVVLKRTAKRTPQPVVYYSSLFLLTPKLVTEIFMTDFIYTLTRVLCTY